MKQVLDHGLVRLVDHMGNDLSIVRAARVSYDADWRTDDDEVNVNFEANAAFIAAANPAAVSEILDRLEAAEKDIALKEKLIDALGLGLNAAAHERDNLLARIREMERQEPVAWLHETRRDSDVVTNAVKHVWGKVAVGSMAAYSIPLYLAPGAKGE